MNKGLEKIVNFVLPGHKPQTTTLIVATLTVIAETANLLEHPARRCQGSEKDKELQWPSITANIGRDLQRGSANFLTAV